MTQNSLGHVVEIFDKVLNVPAVDSLSFKRLGDPVILDSYSLFDRKAEGDWRIVAHDLDYRPSKQESVRYVYGVADNVKLVDILIMRALWQEVSVIIHPIPLWATKT
ncbi:hypothetical protein [Pseudomonas putida]|uniref:hypothetical protein n=1 Tax=Pseudomonas putida TaxID=303 RepID=UPI0021AB58EF|nr:hypothetical protein [Pseudomonas putida]